MVYLPVAAALKLILLMLDHVPVFQYLQVFRWAEAAAVPAVLVVAAPAVDEKTLLKKNLWLSGQRFFFARKHLFQTKTHMELAFKIAL